MGFPKNEEELRESIEEGDKFQIKGKLSKRCKVMEVVKNNKEVSKLAERIPPGNYSKKTSWFIKTKTKEGKYYLIHIIPDSSSSSRPYLKIYSCDDEAYEDPVEHDKSYIRNFRYRGYKA